MTNDRFWNGCLPLFSAALPVTAAPVPLTPALIARAVLLSGSAGVADGWLFWRHSPQAAMVAYATGQIWLPAAAWMASTVLLSR